MAQTVSVIVGEEDRKQLAVIASDRARPLKHVQRADIILRSAERRSVLEVAELVGVSRPAVWRWQARYAEQGIDALLGVARLPAPDRRAADPDKFSDFQDAATLGRTQNDIGPLHVLERAGAVGGDHSKL